MRPVLRSALPWRKPEPEVADLKPWVRRVATTYIVLLVPLLALILVVMILHAPRVFATAYDSFGLRSGRVRAAFDQGEVGTGLGDGFQCLALLLPALGIVVSSGRVGKRVGSGALRWSEGSVARRTIAFAGMGAILGLAAYTWWPNGDYRPIQPGERGTIQGAIKSFEAIPSGRPSLTPQRQAQLNGAPFESSSKQTKPKPKASSNKQSGTHASSSTTTTPTGTDTTTTTNTTTEPATTGTSTTPSTYSTQTSTTPSDTGTQTTPTDSTTSTTPTDTSTSTTPTTP